MSTKPATLANLDALFDEPRPLDKFINEVLAVLDISQQELAEPAGLTQTTISKLARRKTVSPSVYTLEKIRTGLIEGFGVSPDRLTMGYLLDCRKLTATVDASQVDGRFAELDEWLNTQPDAVQETFWETLGSLVKAIDTAGKAPS